MQNGGNKGNLCVCIYQYGYENYNYLAEFLAVNVFNPKP